LYLVCSLFETCLSLRRFRNDVGFSGPERLFLLVALEPVHITVTTCPLAGISPAPYSDFSDYFRL
jgi:hypothetical protein